MKRMAPKLQHLVVLTHSVLYYLNVWKSIYPRSRWSWSRRETFFIPSKRRRTGRPAIARLRCRWSTPASRGRGERGYGRGGGRGFGRGRGGPAEIEIFQ